MKSIDQIKEVLLRKGYKFFEGRPYDLNIIGIRNSDDFTNKFSDDLHVIYYKTDETGKKEWKMDVLRWTTKAGISDKSGPTHPPTVEGITGVAILKENQYLQGWQFVDTMENHHHYPSLLQQKPVAVYRDGNLDLKIDRTAKTQIGLFGINIHQMGKDLTPGDKWDDNIKNWSAGCQGCPLPEFDTLVDLLRKQQASYRMPVLQTYTLLNATDFVSA